LLQNWYYPQLLRNRISVYGVAGEKTVNQSQEFKSLKNGRVMMKTGAGKAIPGTVDHYVELLCQQGCGKVNQFIDALRSGQTVPGIEELGKAERQALLEELESIMAVYHCNCDDG
jgi:hypothetical protein